MIGAREPVPFDVARVAEEAAARGVAMEINSSPERLDLSDVNARLAREKGCRFVIDTDAHATSQLDNLRYGVFQARRAGLTKGDVLNALPWEKFRGALARRGGSGARPARAAATAKPSAKAPKPEPKSKPAARTPRERPAGKGARKRPRG
jgi:hypothetical protein